VLCRGWRGPFNARNSVIEVTRRARLSKMSRGSSEMIVDAHCDVAQAMVDQGLDIGRRLRSTHFDLVRAREGGLAAQFFALFVSPDDYHGEAAWRRTRAMLEAVEAAARAHPRRLALARSAQQVRVHHRAGRIAALVGVEGAHGFGTSSPDLLLARLRLVAKRGVRYLGLTWNNSNAVAGASVDEGGGLTALGRRVVRECERLGVVVDLSHASDQTARDVLAMARRPVIASHSNARALCDVPRNLPDDLLRAIGRRGGVIGVNFFAGFLDAKVFAALEQRREAGVAQFEALRRRYQGNPGGLMTAEQRLVRASLRDLAPVPLSRLLDHVEHIVKVAGPHAVGLGADFDGMFLAPKGLDDVAAYPRLARELARRFPKAVVRGILGENLLRVLEECEYGASRTTSATGGASHAARQ
jgi:membrane dipeptidase